MVPIKVEYPNRHINGGDHHENQSTRKRGGKARTGRYGRFRRHGSAAGCAGPGRRRRAARGDYGYRYPNHGTRRRIVEPDLFGRRRRNRVAGTARGGTHPQAFTHHQARRRAERQQRHRRRRDGRLEGARRRAQPDPDRRQAGDALQRRGPRRPADDPDGADRAHRHHHRWCIGRVRFGRHCRRAELRHEEGLRGCRPALQLDRDRRRRRHAAERVADDRHERLRRPRQRRRELQLGRS